MNPILSNEIALVESAPFSTENKRFNIHRHVYSEV